MEGATERAVVVPLDEPEVAADLIVALDDRRGVDAVVAVDDRGVLVAAAAGERLGFPHNPPDAVAATRDKAAMRRAARRGRGAPARVRGGRRTSCPRSEFPCVLKPLRPLGQPGRDPGRRHRVGAGGGRRASARIWRRTAARRAVRARRRGRGRGSAARRRSSPCSRSSTSPTRSTGRTSRRRSTSRRRDCPPRRSRRVEIGDRARVRGDRSGRRARCTPRCGSSGRRRDHT